MLEKTVFPTLLLLLPAIRERLGAAVRVLVFVECPTAVTLSSSACFFVVCRSNTCAIWDLETIHVESVSSKRVPCSILLYHAGLFAISNMPFASLGGPGPVLENALCSGEHDFRWKAVPARAERYF